jgi:predicted transcriptional regulator
MFNLDKSTIHWYLQKFNNDGIVEFNHVGKFRQCVVNNEAKMVLLRFMPV